MNFKHKLVYMLIGCLFTLAGYLLASLGDGVLQSTHAQQNTKEVIDEIVARKIIVVNDAGKSVVVIGESEKGGAVAILNNAGKEVSTLEAGAGGGGILSVCNKEGMTRAMLAANSSGMYLPSVEKSREREGEKGVTLSPHDYATSGTGILSIYNKNGFEVATLGTSTSDSGILSIYNKDWRVSARIGVDTHGWGGFQYFKGKWRTY